MVTQVQHLRSSVPNQRPQAGSQAPGVIYINWPDKQLGVMDANTNPQDLIAVRYHSEATTYAPGDFVVHGSDLYSALDNISPGAFNASQWRMIGAVELLPPTDTTLGGVFAGEAGPGEVMTGIAFTGEPIFRAVVIPTPTPATLGGVYSGTALDGQVMIGIGTDGAPTFGTPASSYVLPPASTTALGGVFSATGAASQFMTGIDANGIPQFGTPAQQVLTTPTATTLGGVFADQAPAGSYMKGIGVDGRGVYEPITTYTLTAPTATKLGGVFKSNATQTNEFITGVDANGNFTYGLTEIPVCECTAPTPTELGCIYSANPLTGQAVVGIGTDGHVIYGPISSQTYTLPPASTTALGGVFSSSAPFQQYMSGIDSSGRPVYSPAADLGISGGSDYVLPVATASTLGGVLASANPGGQFVTGVAANGALNYASAPVVSVNSKTGAVTLTAADVGAAATSHTHAAATAAALGMVFATPNPGGQFVTGINASGQLTYGAAGGTYTLPAASAGALGGVFATANPGGQFVTGIAANGALTYGPATAPTGTATRMAWYNDSGALASSAYISTLLNSAQTTPAYHLIVSKNGAIPAVNSITGWGFGADGSGFARGKDVGCLYHMHNEISVNTEPTFTGFMAFYANAAGNPNTSLDAVGCLKTNSRRDWCFSASTNNDITLQNANANNGAANTGIRQNISGLISINGAAWTGSGINLQCTDGGFPLAVATNATPNDWWAVGPGWANDGFFRVSYKGQGGGPYLRPTDTNWTAQSDERLKNIIEPITNGIEKTKQLRAIIGSWKHDENNTRRSFLIAQDVLKVLPEAVDQTNPDELGVSYGDVIPLLVATINEQSARIEALEALVGA